MKQRRKITVIFKLQFVEKGIKTMERKEFLLICQKNAISGEELVTYGGVKYHPISYAIRFDKLGKAKHTAVLHSVKADSILDVSLEDVEPETLTFFQQNCIMKL